MGGGEHTGNAGAAKEVTLLPHDVSTVLQCTCTSAMEQLGLTFVRPNKESVPLEDLHAKFVVILHTASW